MVDTKPLLKTFGAGADVFGQIATDKSTNARRTSVGTTEQTGGLDITNGELLEDVVLSDGSGRQKIPHGLGRVPYGATVIRGEVASPVHCATATASTLTMVFSGTNRVSLWVF